MSRQVDIKAMVSHIVRGDGTDRCRICLGDTKEGQVHLEDTVMMDGENPVTLAELLETITGVQVPLDGDLPPLLCTECYISAINASNFRTLCQMSAKQWTTTVNLLDNIYPESKKTVKMIAVINDGCISITEEQIVKIKEQKPMEKTVEKAVNMKKFKCQCPNCGKWFLYAQHLFHHLRDAPDSQRACHMCAEIMTRAELIEHLVETHKRKPYACKKCPAMFRTSNQYNFHKDTAHSKGACTCGDCGCTFQSLQAYAAHLSIHNPRNCPNCNQLFRNQKCYTYHVKKCCNLDKSRTDIHQTKSKTTVPVKKEKKNINVGMRGSANTESYCDYCNKKFAGKKFVLAHIQIVHTRETHTPCIYCGKLLAAAHMTTHVKKHLSNETYECGHCGLTLKSKVGYSQHIRRHTGEKPYQCQYCSETFLGSSRRSEHIRKAHNKDEKKNLKHVCSFCPARFQLPYRLKKHIASVHSDGTDSAKFECTECHQEFNSCRGLLHHSRKHQKDSDISKKIKQ